jgi:Protein of unknown function (DUF2637)
VKTILSALGVITAAIRRGFSAMVVGAALATVVFVSGFISYTHICALTLASRQSWKTAHLYPFAVDAPIVAGSVYFMENSGKRRRWLGLIGIVPGVAESLYANWQSAAGFGLHDQLWATVPAQAFACSTVLFERWLHNRRAAAGERRSAEELLAAALADAEGLREALASAHALADAALAVLPRQVPAPREGDDAGRAPLQLPAWMMAGRQAGPAEPVRAKRPKADRPARPRLVETGGEDARRPLPQDKGELRELVRASSRNGLVRDYQVSYHQASKLRAQYGDQEGAEKVA